MSQKQIEVYRLLDWLINLLNPVLQACAKKLGQSYWAMVWRMKHASCICPDWELNPSAVGTEVGELYITEPWVSIAYTLFTNILPYFHLLKESIFIAYTDCNTPLATFSFALRKPT